MIHTSSDRGGIELWSVSPKKLIFSNLRLRWTPTQNLKLYFDQLTHYFENPHRYQKVQNKISHSLTQWPAHAKSKKIKNRFGHHFENQYIWLIIGCLSIPITVYYRFLNDDSGKSEKALNISIAIFNSPVPLKYRKAGSLTGFSQNNIKSNICLTFKYHLWHRLLKHMHKSLTPRHLQVAHFKLYS